MNFADRKRHALFSHNFPNTKKIMFEPVGLGVREVERRKMCTNPSEDTASISHLNECPCNQSWKTSRGIACKHLRGSSAFKQSSLVHLSASHISNHSISSLVRWLGSSLLPWRLVAAADNWSKLFSGNWSTCNSSSELWSLSAELSVSEKLKYGSETSYYIIALSIWFYDVLFWRI